LRKPILSITLGRFDWEDFFAMPENWYELSDRAMVAEAIRHLSEDELRFLNRLIVDQLNSISRTRNTVMLARFNVGDRVIFPTSSGDRKSGVIVRLNKKTASIDTDDGQHWNVHPHYLVPVETRRLESPEII
jgi:hypothetical protein